MPFDWMEPKRNPEFARTLKAKREAMYRTEIEDRAALMHRLGHSRDSTRTRLTARIAWDFENGGAPVPGTQVDAILERVYGGNSRTAPRPKAK